MKNEERSDSFMAAISERLVLTKVFTEIRFSPSLLFSDLKLLTGYKNYLSSVLDFTSYEKQTERINGYAADEKKIVDVFNNRLIIDFNDPANYDEFVTFCYSIIDEYTKKFEVTKFDRTGIRFNIAAKFDRFEDAKKLFFDKFLHVLKEFKPPEQDLLSGCNSGKVELYYSLKDGKLNIAILPVKLQLLEMKVRPDLQQETAQTTIEGLLFDMDYFKDGGVKLPDLKAQLENGMTVVNTKAALLLKALGV